MSDDKPILPTIFKGWHDYQTALIRALEPLSTDQLALRLYPDLRSIGMITTHIIGARARWFYHLLGEGGEDFKDMSNWERRGRRVRSAAELVSCLEKTWQGMHAAIARWTPEEWQQTYPGEDESEPQVITRQWVIWHLIEHDLHHGGEISFALGAQGIRAIEL